MNFGIFLFLSFIKYRYRQEGVELTDAQLATLLSSSDSDNPKNKAKKKRKKGSGSSSDSGSDTSPSKKKKKQKKGVDKKKGVDDLVSMIPGTPEVSPKASPKASPGGSRSGSSGSSGSLSDRSWSGGSLGSEGSFSSESSRGSYPGLDNYPRDDFDDPSSAGKGHTSSAVSDSTAKGKYQSRANKDYSSSR